MIIGDSWQDKIDFLLFKKDFKHDPEPRPIEVLSKLDTYQGMTDSEIDEIIKYKTKIMMQSKMMAYEQALREDAAREEERRSEELHRATLKHLQSLWDGVTFAPNVPGAKLK